MSDFAQEIGRIYYIVESDTSAITYNFGVYTEEARDQHLARLAAEHGTDRVWWESAR